MKTTTKMTQRFSLEIPDVPEFWARLGATDNRMRQMIYIFLNQHLRRRRLGKSRNGFIPMGTAIMDRRLCGHGRFRQLADLLQNRGLLEVDGAYWFNRKGREGKARGYKLITNYDREGSRHVAITDPYLVRRQRQLQDKANARKGKAHEWVDRWIRRIEVDLVRMNELIDGIIEQELRAETREVIEQGRNTLDDYRAAARLQAMGMAQAATAPEVSHVDDFGRRLHWAGTGLLAKLRGCIAIDGQALVSIDVGCSQPLFAGLALLDDWQAYQRGGMPNTRVAGVFKQRRPELGRMVIGNRIVTPTPFAGLPGDVVAFVQAAADGKLYDMFNSRGISRADAKVEFFGSFLFNSAGAMVNQQVRHQDCPPMQVPNTLSLAVKEQFPTVWAWAKASKLRCPWDRKADRERPHRKLAKRMQRAESAWMYGRVISTLRKHHPHVPCLTIHDSVLTYPEHIELVVKVMQNAFAKLGVRPTLRVSVIDRDGKDTKLVEY